MSSLPGEPRSDADPPGGSVHPLMQIPSPLPAPAVPAGYEVGPPDFVGVGAQRSGTTWWWSVISSHPDVALITNSGIPQRNPVQRKELHFFGHYGEVADIDQVLYHRHFPRPAGKAVGEWTPRYMYDFWTPPMLRQVAPDARILVMLRDPLQRFVSGLAHTSRMAEAQGLDGATGPFVSNEVFSRGRYWSQLQNLLRYFDRDQLLILQYEQCLADVAGQARRTFAFLGLDPGGWRMHDEVSRPAGAPSGRKPRLGRATRDALRSAYQPDVERLLTDFPELDPALWPTAWG